NAIAVELWRLLSTDELNKVKFPGWQEWDQPARHELTGKRPAAGVSRQMLVRELTTVVADTKDFAHQLLTGKRTYGGEGTPTPEAIDPFHADPVDTPDPQARHYVAKKERSDD